VLQDYKLGLRMLRKFPGLTIAGGLALAIAIGIGAGWYDVMGKILAPAIPLPDGDRIVLIETQNALTNEPEPRALRELLEWRRELRTIEGLGAYRTDTRNLAADNAAPEAIQVAELTAAAFATARMSPLLGRGLLESDEVPRAPDVVVVGYDVWQRSLGARDTVVGSTVNVGNTRATVIGVMPKGFGYPVNHDAWMPLPLRGSYGALEGGAIGVIGRLAPGVSLAQANAELRVSGERTAAALPSTHTHLRPHVLRLGGGVDDLDIAPLALRNVPVLMVLAIACLSVGTLVYARTATREGEIAIRSALGASRTRIIVQLFVEALVLASIAAAAGLMAADWTLARGIESANRASGGAPFWLTPGLRLSAIVYAAGLAIVCAAMLSLLPALKATRARVQPHLANLGSAGATLRFGRVWTSAMIVQVALTAIGIPVAFESVSQTVRKLHMRAQFPSHDYLAARIDLDRPFEQETAPGFQERRAQAFAALARRIAEQPGVVAVTFANRAPGSLASTRSARVQSDGGGPAFTDSFRTLAVGPGFFEAFDRPIVAGRAFHGGDSSPAARTVIVNEAFARAFSRDTAGSPVGARLRYSETSQGFDERRGAASDTSAASWFEIVGVVRDFDLDPDDDGNEQPYVFHAASAETVSPLVMSVRMRANPGPLAARLPIVAAGVDARLIVQEARPLNEWVRDRDMSLIVTVGAQVAITALVLFLSAMGVFSLMSITVSRRTREIGLRAALGANSRQVLAGILSRAVALMGSGAAAGGALLLLAVALGQGPSGRPAQDVPVFAVYLGITSAVMLAAGLLACLAPARHALRINPTDALRMN
jgi:predicted permease